ncbi:MAG: hypothetical protein IJW40_01555 [Clostridia bacterium]|nr:hypothetical protein [Clostridia bacterium]
MRSFMTKGAHAQIRLEEFPGLKAYAAVKDHAAAQELCNLRCLGDGTLSRREGIRPIATLPERLRGAISVTKDGETVIYAAAGAHIYSIIRASDGTHIWNQIGQMRSDEGEVSFFTLDGELILMDGLRMYALSPEAAEEMVPYLPLYGKDWSADDYGTVYEPRNVLTDQVNVRYVMSSHSNTLKLNMEPVSLDAVYIDGVLCDPAGYTHNIYALSLVFEEIVSMGSVVDVIMTLPEERAAVAMREDFFRCRCAVRPGEAGRTVALFGGGNETGVLYLTREIAKEDRERCRTLLPHSRMVYLQADGRMEVGDGSCGVNAMVRHYDRTLLMTAAGCWTTDLQALTNGTKTDAPRAINSRLGCSTYGGALLVGNSPISIHGKDVLIWNADTDELDECNAYSICEAVRTLLPDDLGENGRVFYDDERDELWVYTLNGGARVFVRQSQGECWTTFDFGPLSLRGVFGCVDAVGLLGEYSVFLTDPDAPCDTDADGAAQPIVCTYASHTLNFDHKGQTLRPYEVLLCTDADAGQRIEVTLTAADGKTARAELTATGAHPCELQRRLSPGRCRHATVRIRCDCVGAFSLRGIGILAGV